MLLWSLFLLVSFVSIFDFYESISYNSSVKRTSLVEHSDEIFN